MRRVATMGLLALGVAAAGGCYSHTATREVVQPVPIATTSPPLAPSVETTAYNFRDDRDPTLFAGKMRARMDRVESVLRDEVARGRISADALRVSREKRLRVEDLLSRYSADGEMQRDERRDVEHAVEDMRNVEDGRRFHRPAVGGGPYYYNVP